MLFAYIVFYCKYNIKVNNQNIQTDSGISKIKLTLRPKLIGIAYKLYNKKLL